MCVTLDFSPPSLPMPLSVHLNIGCSVSAPFTHVYSERGYNRLLFSDNYYLFSPWEALYHCRSLKAVNHSKQTGRWLPVQGTYPSVLSIW